MWRAIISSSSVGTTRRATRLAGVEMQVAPASLAAGSSSAPSQAQALGDAGADRGGVLADAGGEDEGVEAAEGGGELAGVEAAAVGEVVDGEAPRRDRRWRGGRACRWRRRRGP